MMVLFSQSLGSNHSGNFKKHKQHHRQAHLSMQQLDAEISHRQGIESQGGLCSSTDSILQEPALSVASGNVKFRVSKIVQGTGCTGERGARS